MIYSGIDNHSCVIEWKTAISWHITRHPDNTVHGLEASMCDSINNITLHYLEHLHLQGTEQFTWIYLSLSTRVTLTLP